VGIPRTLKTQEITFMYKKQPFGKREQKFYVIIFNKNKLLYMPSTKFWYEKIKRNEEECPNKINKESWV